MLQHVCVFISWYDINACNDDLIDKSSMKRVHYAEACINTCTVTQIQRCTTLRSNRTQGQHAWAELLQLRHFSWVERPSHRVKYKSGFRVSEQLPRRELFISVLVQTVQPLRGKIWLHCWKMVAVIPKSSVSGSGSLHASLHTAGHCQVCSSRRYRCTV